MLDYLLIRQFIWDTVFPIWDTVFPLKRPAGIIFFHGLLFKGHTKYITKGQLISKCLFGIFNSSKKGTKKFDLTTMVPQVEFFSFVFFGRI